MPVDRIGWSVAPESALPKDHASETHDHIIRPRVFIVSDVRLFREGLAWSLSQQSDVEFVGAAAPGTEVLDHLVSAAPAVVLLDFAMPRALDLPKAICRVLPTAKVIAFAVGEVEHELIACAEAGIVGFVTRDGSVDDLVKSIRSALRGEIICSARVTGLLFQRVAALSEASQQSPVKPQLTPREHEVAVLVNRGLSNKEIARTLRIGSATVKNHVHNILEKLHVSRRSEAAALLRGETLGRRQSRAAHPPSVESDGRTVQT